MSEFGVWLKEVDVLLGERVKRLFETEPRSEAIAFWANLPQFMNLYALWQYNREPQVGVDLLVGHTEHPSRGEQ